MKRLLIILLAGLILLSACTTPASTTPTSPAPISPSPKPTNTPTVTEVPKVPPPLLSPTPTPSMDESKVHLDQGNGYLKQGAWDKAITEFNEAIKLNPKFADAYVNRANTYELTHSYDLAVIDYTKAIEYSDTSSVSWRYYYRGQAYLKQGNNDKAIVDFTKALETARVPYNSFYSARALAYLGRHDYSLAIADSSKVIETSDYSDDAYWTRGQAYVAIGEKDKALADYKKCLTLSADMEKYDNKIRELNEVIRQRISKMQ